MKDFATTKSSQGWTEGGGEDIKLCEKLKEVKNWMKENGYLLGGSSAV